MIYDPINLFPENPEAMYVAYDYKTGRVIGKNKRPTYCLAQAATFPASYTHDENPLLWVFRHCITLHEAITIRRKEFNRLAYRAAKYPGRVLGNEDLVAYIPSQEAVLIEKKLCANCGDCVDPTELTLAYRSPCPPRPTPEKDEEEIEKYSDICGDDDYGYNCVVGYDLYDWVFYTAVAYQQVSVQRKEINFTTCYYDAELLINAEHGLHTCSHTCMAEYLRSLYSHYVVNTKKKNKIDTSGVFVMAD